MSAAHTCLSPIPPESAGQPLPSSLTRYTGFLVAKAHQRLFGMFDAVCAKAGLEVRCPGILHLLDEHGPMPQQQIGRVLRIDRTSMVKLVDGLEKRGHARRTDDPTDRRAYRVAITAKGRKSLQQIGKAADAMERKLLADFSDRERQIIRRGLLTLAG